jgi:hypothetical protein
MPEYGEHILEWLRIERPDLAHLVRLHETGTVPAVLDDVCAVFFWLGDPLEILYPDCFGEALAIEVEAEQRSIRILNRPTALATFGKDVQATRFEEASVPTPPALLVAGADELERCADRFGYPLLIRGSRSFGQEGTRIVRSRGVIRSLGVGDLPQEAIVTPLVDTRGRPAGSRKGDLWTRYYHRKRALLIGEECVPYSLFFSPHPVVSQDTSVYGRYDSWQARLRPYGWPGRRGLRLVRQAMGLRRAFELESEFAGAAVEHEDVLRRAAAALGLEFLAFDYASLPSGELMVWEANPYPYLPSARGHVLGKSRRSEERTRGVYEAFAACFESLLAEADSARRSANI